MRVFLLVIVIAGAAVAINLPRPSQRPTLVVLAAASLTEVGPQLKQAYEAENDIDVRLSYGGSSLLAAQVIEGAPADVILSASSTAISRLDLLSVLPFAENSIVIAVERGNPRGITDASSLSRLKFAACALEVPCGASSAPLLKRFRLTPVTWENDVKAVAGKVAFGEVDAGLVYQTDVRADARLSAVDPGMDLRTTYVAGVITPQGKTFSEFLASERGQQILRSAGFGSP